MRAPTIAFGRCAITGEWGKIVNIDMGDITIQTPDTENGVEIDAEGKVTFTQWKPVVFETQVSLSEAALQQLHTFVQTEENPVPAVTPEVDYNWCVMFTDGSCICMYDKNEDGSDRENNYNIIEQRLGEVAQVSYAPRYSTTLPTFTLVMATGKFYMNGKEIDVDYDGDIPDGKSMFCARENTITFGSAMETNGLNRYIVNNRTNTLYLLGWKTADRACVIGINNLGHWRPYDFR